MSVFATEFCLKLKQGNKHFREKIADYLEKCVDLIRTIDSCGARIVKEADAQELTNIVDELLETKALLVGLIKIFPADTEPEEDEENIGKLAKGVLEELEALKKKLNAAAKKKEREE